MTLEEILVYTKDSFNTESKITLETPLLEIFDLLGDNKTTGEVIIHLTSGGIDGIKVLEKTPITGLKSDAVRKVLGFTED